MTGMTKGEEKPDLTPRLDLHLPVWIADEVGDSNDVYPTLEERMAFAVRLSARNIEHGGGPFGAAVFESENGRLVAAGVNLVVPLNCSLAHAEAMALVAAQQALQTHDLGAPGLPALELVSSAQPCIQCYGMVWWSGVRRLVAGATKEDVEALTGFREGPVPDDWDDQLEHRPPLAPVEVIRDVLRAEARAVLERYRDLGGAVYNPGSSPVRHTEQET